MKLVIDVGNSLVKTAVFDGDHLVELNKSATLTAEGLQAVLTAFPGLNSAILSSVRKEDESFERALQQLPFIKLDEKTPLPFRNRYATPDTLGKDRVAAVAGAQGLFPDTNVLVIDAGTSITYDLLTAGGDYLGGAISPGMAMRFEALHTFTGRLPFIKQEEYSRAELIGNSTETSILSGVLNGVLQEVDGIIERYKVRFPELKIVLCGGDNYYFDKYLKNNIFAAPNLVLLGLKRILDFNEKP